MLLPFYKVFALLDRRERRQAVLLLCMILVMGVIETVGLTSIMPLIAVLTNPDVIANNRFLNVVYVGLGYTSIDDFTFSLAIAAFVLLIGGTAFKALTTWALTRFAYMRRHSLACRLIGGYMNQPYEWFLNRHSADLAKNALSEVDLLVAHALLPAMRLLSNCTVVFFLFVLLVAVEPLLAIGVTVVISGVYGCIYFASARYLGSVGAERLSTNNQRYKVAQEALSAIKDVKVAGLEDAFLTRFKVPSKRFAETLTNFQLVGQLPRYAMEAIIFGGLLLVVLYSMSSVGGFQEILPILALYTLAAYRLIPTLQAIYNDLTQIRFSEPALESLDRDLRELPSQHAATEPLAARPISPECSQSIRLQQIKYTYPATHREALAGVDVDISACTTVGFVGTTGSGKTTCVDIILGLLTPESGELWVGGELLTKDKLRSWQQNIGYVPQSANLVDDTVSANIAFGVQSHMVNMEAVERAARIANLHRFIVSDMPSGYDTVIGERGVRLSGGQRQRIGIARALYHDPDVLVLDEATSALDSLTEQEVMGAISNLSHRKTIIIIAHRLSTIRQCDRIYLFEQGQVAGWGTYEELMQRAPQFRAMTKV